MRLLLTSHRFWPSVGGTEEVVAQLASRFAKLGHDVTVATSDEPGSPPEDTRDGYRIRRFALRRVGKFRFPPPEYAKLVRDGEFDAVHLHGQRVWSTDHVYRHLKRARSPLVFTAHGFYQHHVERTPVVDAYYYRRILPRALGHVRAVTALTAGERDELVGFGVDAAKVRVIPDGLDPAEFEGLPHGFRERHAFAADELLLLYVGGTYRNKRVDRLVDVAAETRATLAVIGRDAGREQDALAKRAHERGARVRFMGALPRHEVLSAFREADLFLLASEFEGFALVLLEAMAAGLPFVATRAGAAPDLVLHGAGLSVEPERLAAETAALLADAPRRRRMGEAGRAAIHRYDWTLIAQRYLALYEEVSRR